MAELVTDAEWGRARGWRSVNRVACTENGSCGTDNAPSSGAGAVVPGCVLYGCSCLVVCADCSDRPCGACRLVIAKEGDNALGIV